MWISHIEWILWISTFRRTGLQGECCVPQAVYVLGGAILYILAGGYSRVSKLSRVRPSFRARIGVVPMAPTDRRVIVK